MIDVDELLKPVSDEKPSGEDFTYHEKFLEMEIAAKPPPAASPNAEPEEPDWKAVKQKTMDVLRECKHLRAGTLLTLALVKLGAVEGLRDGFALMKGLTEKFWPDLYPQLDASDNNDPTERLNTLSSLASPKFGFQIQQIEICRSTSMGRITLGQYLAAKNAKPPTEDEPRPKDAGPGMDQINAAFRDSDPEAVKATLGFVNEAISDAQSIESFVDEKLGAGNGVNFESLHKLLQSMRDAVAPFANNGASDGAAESSTADSSGDGGGEASSGSRARSGVGGAPAGINSGDDVIRQIDLICDYYRKNEPSSPVPLILQRAKNLVNKDFTSIMSDLTPEALSQLQVITGKADK